MDCLFFKKGEKPKAVAHFLIILLAGFFWLTPAVPHFARAAFPEYTGVDYADRLLSSLRFRDTNRHWARVPIYRSAAQGIINGYGGGYFRPDKPVTKEEALTMLVRLKGLDARAQQAAAEAAIGGAKWKDLAGYWANGYLQVAVEEGILTEQERAELENERRSGAQRQEVAVWAARTLGLAPSYSSGQHALRSLNDWLQIDPRYMGLVASVVNEGIMVGTGDGYFKPGKSVTRGEMAVILDKISPRLSGPRNLEFRDGYVVSRDVEWERTQFGQLRKISYLIRDTGGQTIRLIAESAPGSPYGIVRDFVVYRDNRLGLNDLLKPGDSVRLILTGDKRIIFAQVANSSPGVIRGTFVGANLSDRTVRVRDSSGRNIVLPLSSLATVTINDRGAQLGDLISGQEIYVTVENGQVTAIRGSTGLIPEAYSLPEREVIDGRVRFIDHEGRKITLSVGSQWVTYELGSRTEIVKEGALIPAERIKIGDHVRAYVERGNYLARIEIAGKSGLVDSIVRGKIEKVYPVSGQVVLSDAESFFYGDWYPEGGTLTLEVDAGTVIYAASGTVDLDWLEDTAVGSEIYAAVKEGFGGKKAAKMLIKSGPARGYNNFIDEIDWAAGTIDLEIRPRNVSLGPQTIVLHEGRMVDIEDIDKEGHVFLETNQNENGEEGALIFWDEFYPQDYGLLRGEIDGVDERELKLKAYSEYKDNAWDEARSSSRKTELEVSPEALIIDARSPGGVTFVGPGDFFYSKFTGEFDGDYAVTVSRDNLVEAMVIYDQGFSGDKTSIALVASATPDKVTLDRVKDWSEAHGQWKSNKYSVTLDTKGAVIFKDGEITQPASLHPGDVLYLIHDMKKASIIFVQ